MTTPRIEGAEVVIPCSDLAITLDYFVDKLDFQLEMIFPADDPRVAVLRGHGLRLRLDREAGGDPGTLRLSTTPESALSGEERAPNGTVIQWSGPEATGTPEPPEQRLLICRPDASNWVTGRAGMQYRDLLPGRLGGFAVASHIRIPEGGPVPDYVHYHRIDFQFIYCWKGWVRVVYEDQGEPFVLRAGDCVLQPPGIRHRVLECSPGLEVLELGSPAEHATCTAPELALPGEQLHPERRYDGQRFVRFQASNTPWKASEIKGFEQQDTGIGEATGGVGGVRVLRPAGATTTVRFLHDGQLMFWFLLDGEARLELDATPCEKLTTGTAVVLPPGTDHRLDRCSESLRLLEVRMPSPEGIALPPRARAD